MTTSKQDWFPFPKEVFLEKTFDTNFKLLVCGCKNKKKRTTSSMLKRERFNFLVSKLMGTNNFNDEI